MIRSAIVDGTTVTNIILLNSADDLGTFDAVECTDDVQIGWSYKAGVFSAPAPPTMSLNDAKQARISLLTSLCAAAVTGGYSSQALGTVHSYPSGITDQINMMGSVTASLLPDLAADWSTPFWCADAQGNWAFQPHSVAQIQAAGSDGKAHVVTCQGTLAQLSATVMAATSVAAVNAVSWPEGQ